MSKPCKSDQRIYQLRHYC